MPTPGTRPAAGCWSASSGDCHEGPGDRPFREFIHRSPGLPGIFADGTPLIPDIPWSASYFEPMNILESLPTVIGIAAVAPALLMLWLVIAADERPGPPGLVWASFLLGAASISLLGMARAPFASMAELTDNPWLSMVLHSVFGIAAPEEIVKVLVILAVATQRARNADPMDIVVYGAAVGLGFAAYENLVYLLKYPEMWRVLAVLRSVLTVPFHGAVGVIAGAYIAIARTSNALGANRGARHFARIKTALLVVLAPVALHSCFDLPLLTLQQHPEIQGLLRRVLEATGLLVGFGTIFMAARLVRRIGAHHAPHSEASRARLSQLRSMWALLVIGGGAGFAGTAFLLSSIHHWFINPERNVTLLLVPLGLASIAVGVILLALTTAAYMLGRRRLRAIAPRLASVLDF
jgi:RsiW-degrading membrane proteinase PrsW (M82 family)